MIEWYDEVEIGNNTVAVEVLSEWEPADEELHPGYWDITVCERSTGEDITRLVNRQTLHRLEANAFRLTEASWDDAAIDLAIDIFCGR